MHEDAPSAPGAIQSRISMRLLSERVQRLVEGYRELGHLHADLDPLGLVQRGSPEISLENYGLADEDLDLVFSSENVAGPNRKTLRDLVSLLRETYCRTIGVQMSHLNDLELLSWLQTRMESTRNRLPMSRADRIRVFQQVIGAEVFEQFLQNKFLGSKRFSLEGAESLIPLLERLVERAARSNVNEIVIGMAHRGRLNVLANVLKKPASLIFAEFQDKIDPSASLDDGGGDVKYHLGFSIDRVFGEGSDEHRVHLSLAFNPSHLEWVNTVVQGRVRAKQDRLADSGRTRALPILIHGDAAFAGQGIIAEALNMSELEGYRVGGTVHIVVNNQVGFTTSPENAKSTTYATDVARMLQIPIFHVNGEDPEAVCQVVDLAVDFRQRFHRDALIELWCYRKLGHNEGDEPSYTQPVMYRAIASKPSIRMAYLAYDDAHPAPEGGPPITVEETDAIAAARRRELEGELEVANKLETPPRPSTFAGAWARLKGGADNKVPEVPTKVTTAAIKEVTRALTTTPPDFHVHPKLQKLIIESRAQMGAGEKPADWGMGEALAFGTLLAQGTRVRLSGQDSRRGTFSHRHSVMYDHEDGHPYTPLAHLGPKQGVFEVIRQPAHGRGRAGLRLRLQPGHARRAHHLGGAVRRLRERGAGDHRPVHQLVGGEVAPGERSRAAPAARHGGAGARALQRAPRSVPQPLRQRQHAGLQPDHAGPVFPRAPAAGAAPLPQAAHHHVAQEPPAAPGGHLADQRLHRGGLPAHHRRSGGEGSGARQAGAALHGQDLLRPHCRARGAQVRRRRHHPRRAAVSALQGRAAGDAGGVSRGDAGGLGAGRAEEHGRLGVHEPGAAAALGRVVSLVGRHATALGQPGDRVGQAAHARADAVGGGSVRKRSDLMAMELRVPALGESVREATLGAWRHAEGDEVSVDEPLVEVESEKATVEVPSPGAGVLRKILRKAGDTVAVGEVIAEIEQLGAQVAASPAKTTQPTSETSAAAVGSKESNGRKGDGGGNGRPAAEPVRAAPSARRALTESGLAVDEVKGSGRGGRISKQDVTRALEEQARAPAPSPAPVEAPAAIRPVPVADGARERVVPMSPLRKTVARRLVEAQHAAAILTTFNEIDMSSVLALRERHQERFVKQHGIKLGFMSFFVKAAIDALKTYPGVNAEVRGADIVYKDHYDIGVAVGGGKGLVVPVVRDADRLSFAEVEATIAELAGRARDNKLALKDLEGGTFTISNGGVYGSLLSTPILNPPQSGILGLHAIQKRPVASGDAVVVRPMMYVALSYDHRLVDGREAVQFLVRVKECVEDPERLLLEV